MSKNNKKDSASVELDLEDLLVPISIFISGIMISFSILYSVGRLDSSDLNQDTTSQNTNSVLGETGELNNPEEDNQPIKVSIENDAVMGDKEKAQVAIVEFSDYECPFCKRHYVETTPKIIEEFVNTKKAIIVFRDLPLDMHLPIAQQEALATECAKDQGGNAKYWAMHDLIFETTASNKTNMTKDKLYELASSIELDTNKFKVCLDSEKFKDEIAEDTKDATNAGITATPGFIVGKLGKDGYVTGNIISGAQPYETFKAAIESYLD